MWKNDTPEEITDSERAARVLERVSLERTELANDEYEKIIKNDTTGGLKGQKLARFDLLPADVLWKVAEHFGRGAEKYAPRNWELGYEWSLSYAALQRHLHAFWDGEDIDPETGSHHLDAVIFHAMALRRFVRSHPELDDRP